MPADPAKFRKSACTGRARPPHCSRPMVRPMFRALAFVACSLAASLTASAAVALPAKENFHLFLLVGQSNMAGRGTVTPADKVPHARVLMLDKSGSWVPAVDPLHFDKPAMVGVGLGRTFANLVADATPGVTIGLIPCAVGGSPIDTWTPGTYYQATQSHPWDDAIRRARLALQAGTLKGILWHQGESDAKRDLAPDYEKKLHALIARFRAELRAPAVPFLAGQLGVFPDSPWDEFKQRIDAAHRGLPAKVARTAYVGAEGLGHKGDKTHFTADAYREFGRRYAEAYLKLVRQP